MSKNDLATGNGFNGISVVICCFNSAQRITKTLEFLSVQKDVTFPWEIILVNNQSTDNTVEIAASCWKEKSSIADLRIIHEPNPGKANALTTGFNHAKYDLILVCDDDNWLQPHYLSRVMGICNEYPTIGMLGGYGKEAWLGEGVPIPDWFEEVQQYYVVGNHIGKSGYLDKGKYQIWGAGSVIRKSIWELLCEKGFKFKNSRMAGRAQGEDAELAFLIAAAGFPMYFDEELTFIHDLSGGRVSIPQLLDQVRLNAVNMCWVFHYNTVSGLVKKQESGSESTGNSDKRAKSTIFNQYSFIYIQGIWALMNYCINIWVRYILLYLPVKAKWIKRPLLMRKMLLTFHWVHIRSLILQYRKFRKSLWADYEMIKELRK
ncbi:MAG: glycosyltransferase family 2 protein [Chitinophagaceae bacterium]